MQCVRLSKFGVNYLFITLTMPKYAVAVGRKQGVFDTYAECLSQVSKYPNAKFKKFETRAEAEEFVRTYGGSGDSLDGMHQTCIENVNKPQLIKLGMAPSSDVSLVTIIDRLSSIENKLTSFITTATKTLENITSRITNLENNKRGADWSALAEEQNQVKKPKTQQDLTLSPDSFQRNSNGFVVVYTDGACTNNGRAGAKAGIGVWFGPNHPLNISAPVKGPPTNNTAEIQAARVAINTAVEHGIKNISVHTDSQFTINCITQWIHKWKKNDWKLSSGGPVKNKIELVKLDQAIQSIDAVEWVYVAGHKGHYGNEQADSLARSGAQLYQSNITFADHVDGAQEEDSD